MPESRPTSCLSLPHHPGKGRSTAPAALDATTAGRCSSLLQRRPGQQEALLADAGEVHNRLGLVARTFDGGDHAVAELAVMDVVAHLQADGVGTTRGRTGGLHRRLDPVVAMGATTAADH